MRQAVQDFVGDDQAGRSEAAPRRPLCQVSIDPGHATGQRPELQALTHSQRLAALDDPVARRGGEAPPGRSAPSARLDPQQRIEAQLAVAGAELADFETFRAAQAAPGAEGETGDHAAEKGRQGERVGVVVSALAEANPTGAVIAPGGVEEGVVDELAVGQGRLGAASAVRRRSHGVSRLAREAAHGDGGTCVD